MRLSRRLAALALLLAAAAPAFADIALPKKDRKSTRLNSSHANISYAVFCLKKKKRQGAARNDRVLAAHARYCAVRPFERRQRAFSTCPLRHTDVPPRSRPVSPPDRIHHRSS